jgi:putative redox protein
MAVDNILIQFDPNFVGTMTSPSGSIKLGDQEGGMEPYHLLFGALGSCYYATFLSIANKKRLTFSKVEIEVSGEKRNDVPPTLEHVKIKLVVHNPSNEDGLLKSAHLGAQFCSIHETVSKVAQMEHQIEFVYD